MFEREKIEIRILRNYLLSSEFRVINSPKSSEVQIRFVPPPPPDSSNNSDNRTAQSQPQPQPQQGSNNHHHSSSSSSIGSGSSVAIRAAISGLHKELARLEREERLLVKFQRESNSHEATAATTASTEATSLLSGEFVTMSREDVSAP
jgi:hypothetical protein